LHERFTYSLCSYKNTFQSTIAPLAYSGSIRTAIVPVVDAVAHWHSKKSTEGTCPLGWGWISQTKAANKTLRCQPQTNKEELEGRNPRANG